MDLNKLKRTGLFCLGIILAGCLIQAAGQIRGNSLVFPGIDEIVRSFFSLLKEGKTWQRICTTLLHLAEALLVSTALGIGIGLAEGLWEWVRQILRPLMILFRSLPMIVLAVVLMVLLQYEYVPVISGVLVLIPMISEAVYEGCCRIEPELIDVYRMNSSLNWMVLRHIYIPLMAGYLNQAFENAAGMGIKIVVSTEYLVQARNSMGREIYLVAYFNEYADIYAYALIMVLLVLFLSALPRGLKNLFSIVGKEHSRVSG